MLFNSDIREMMQLGLPHALTAAEAAQGEALFRAGSTKSNT